MKYIKKLSNIENYDIKYDNLLNYHKYSKFYEIYNYTIKYIIKKELYDHIIIMPAPVTNLKHETSRRGFFHYLIHLLNPLFISLEYSKSFIFEYPICSKIKNIIVPYPSIDNDLFSGKYFHIEKNEIENYYDKLNIQITFKQRSHSE